MRKILCSTTIMFIMSTLLARASLPQDDKQPSRMTGLLNSTSLFIAFWHGAELQSIDTTFLEVVYDLRYRRETTSGNYYEMLTVLQVGRVRQKYYSMIRQFIDNVQINVTKQIKGKAAIPGVGAQYTYTDEDRRIQSIAGVDWLNSEIWFDLPSRKLTERTHDYTQFNLSIEYEERMPKFEWQFTNRTDTICGHPCFAAITKFRGREWTVWYAPSIPVSAGPWKFNDLPGLVLRAHDTQRDYVWECQSISQRAEPIVYYKIVSKILTREKWQRYLRQIHDAPLSMLGNNGDHKFYIKGVLVKNEDNWQIPYNPIECE